MLMHSKFRLFLQLVQPVTCPLVRKVRKAFAVVHEPARMSDNPIKFTAGLTAAVRLVADLENVPKLDNVRIRVCNLHLFVLLFLFAISNNPPLKNYVMSVEWDPCYLYFSHLKTEMLLPPSYHLLIPPVTFLMPG